MQSSDPGTSLLERSFAFRKRKKKKTKIVIIKIVYIGEFSLSFEVS